MSPETWGEFVVLPESRSAVRAAVRVAAVFSRTSGRIAFACPLVLHGPPGTGKSALVQQLLRATIASDEPRTVRTLPAAELPRASDETDDLTDLRSCDLLAIDDFHHLKPPDVETACRLLDHRTARRRPTVVISASGPANLTAFPHRLTNRLSAGLVVRLDPPGLDSRKRLVSHFAGKRNLRLEPDAVNWLAGFATGPRLILGAVEKLRTTGKKSALPLTTAQVRDSLTEPGEPDSPLDRIVAKVCEAFRVKPKDLTGDSRMRPVLVPRQVAMYLAREVAKLSLARIGTHFGGRDHTTVRNAVQRISDGIVEDAKLATTVRELRGGLG